MANNVPNFKKFNFIKKNLNLVNTMHNKIYFHERQKKEIYNIIYYTNAAKFKTVLRCGEL